MNKAEIIRGIETTIEGLNTIKKALAVEVAETPTEAPKSKSVERREKVQKVEPNVAVSENTTEVVDGIDVDALNSMKYNEFKKYASSLGVKCTGTRDEIMERILALGGVEVTEEASEEVEEAPEVKPTKSNKVSGGKKSSNVEADEPTKDEFDEQAEEVAKNTDVEDIIEALADVGVKANKKNAVSLLAEALREGLIELEDDEDEEEAVEPIEDEEDMVDEVDEDEDEEVEDDGDEINSASYFAQFDPKGYNDPKDMTEERAEAVEEKMDDILTRYSDGDLTDEDIASYVEDNATEDEIDLLGDDYTEEDILKLYMELVKRTIDNEGEEHEPGEPYELGEFDVCCGRELKYSKKTKKYICEACGTEYEAE